MDMIPQEVLSSPAAYEHVIVKNEKAISQLMLKQKAFQAMEKLEGWCSKEKAIVLMDLLLTMRPKTVVEVGVFGGKSLVPMAFALKYNQRGKIYGIDPWDPMKSIEGLEQEHADWWVSVDHDAIMNDLIKKISDFDLENYIQLIRATSLDAVIPANEIDFLHIDGNHSEETSMIDVMKWVPLVRKGGLIIFDDLDWKTTAKATEWLDTNCERITEIRGSNIWGIWLKK